MKLVRLLIITILVLVSVLAVLLKPIDYNDIEEQNLLQQASDSIEKSRVYRQSDSLPFNIAYGKINLISGEVPMPMAGYSRRTYDSVHDSLYCRIIMIEKGNHRLFLLSVDLLIFPGVVYNKIQKSITEELPNSLLYASASHTHNGLGGWNDSFGGEIIAGDYHPVWVDDISNSIVKEIRQLVKRKKPADLYYFETDASPFVVNRVQADAPVDGLIRGVKIHTSPSDSVVLFTYSGHPTNITSKSTQLSNDYPGATIKSLQNNGYKFAMFMAGMVGSHRIANLPGRGYDRISHLADSLTSRIVNSKKQPVEGPLIFSQFDLPLGDTQARISGDFVLRNWVFENALGPLQGKLGVAKIGDLTLVNTPCDFSGELFPQINNNGNPLIITSFNGNYIGYITEDSHYETSKNAEVRTMNWVGPHFGNYFVQVINEAILHVTAEEEN